MTMTGVNHGHNTRESFNIYAGMALGGAAILGAIRYSLYHNLGAHPGMLDDVIAWGLTGLTGMIPLGLHNNRPVPLVEYFAATGGLVGMYCADRLREDRLLRERLDAEFAQKVI